MVSTCIIHAQVMYIREYTYGSTLYIGIAMVFCGTFGSIPHLIIIYLLYNYYTHRPHIADLSKLQCIPSV